MPFDSARCQAISRLLAPPMISASPGPDATTSRVSTSTFLSTELIAVTGVSGAGKSSLAFDTLYAEGTETLRRTFSAYTAAVPRAAREARRRADREHPPAIAVAGAKPASAGARSARSLRFMNTWRCSMPEPARSAACGAATRWSPATPRRVSRDRRVARGHALRDRRFRSTSCPVPIRGHSPSRCLRRPDPRGASVSGLRH